MTGTRSTLMRVSCKGVCPEYHRTCSDQCVVPAAEIHLKYNGPLHKGMSSLMFQALEGDRFVSFATMTQEFLFTATREHSKYDCMNKKYQDAWNRAADGDCPQGKLAKPLTNFFWSGADRRAFCVHQKLVKANLNAETAKKKDAARDRKRDDRKKNKDTKNKEPKQKKEPKQPRGVRRPKRKLPTEEDDDSTETAEELAPASGKPLFRTCSDVDQVHRKRGPSVKVLR
jgi:hypothetical protein